MSENWIKPGVKALIRRNCGMTHHAIISRVDDDHRVVSVEWFENGETKGKEVEFDTLTSLNPELSVDLDSSLMKQPGRCRSAIGSFVEEEIDKSTETLSRSISSISLDKMPLTTEIEDIDSREIDIDELETTRISHKEVETTLTLRERAAKKCKTVKEVERLQRNRELRRLEQAVKKEEKEALLNVNSGNPNWQFRAMIKDYRDKLDFKPLTRVDEATENHQITVCVRKRPLNRKEKLSKEVDVVSVPRKNVVVVHEPKNKVDLTKYLENQYFRFDYTFDESCNNETVYNFTAKPLVQTIFDGGMATCFAYGQTGSGKTHTMSGANIGSEKGIYAMVAVDVFKCLECSDHANKNIVVSSSYYEIYGGKVFDLLAKKARLKVLEDGKQQVQIVGLTEKIVRSVADVLFLIECGNNARTSGRTSANSTSSRSHAIFQITLRQGESQKIYGRFHLIDLAGNERGADTSTASRTTRLEGAEINKSLLALKECIRALGRKGSHLPFRGSTLTLVLRDSFIGDKTKTCMIAMISPGMSSCEHSINTLRYADRVKELVNTDVLLTLSDDKQNPQVNSSMFVEDVENDNSLLVERPPSIHKSNQLEQHEREMVAAFRLWMQINSNFNERESKLFLHSKKQNFDSVQFSYDLEQIVGERQKCLAALRDRVAAFRLEIEAEEDVSNKENQGHQLQQQLY